MTIYDYVHAHAKSWMSMHTQEDEDRLKSITVPSEQELLSIQHETAKAYASNKTPLFQKLVASFNYGKSSAQDEGLLNNQQNIEQFIKRIERNVGDLKNTDIATEAARRNTSYQQAYLALRAEWDQIINTITNFSSSAQVEKVIAHFQANLNSLDSQLCSDAQIPFKGDVWKTFTGQLSWISNILKGFYLEAAGTNFFNSKIPEIEGIQAVQTGSIKIPLNIGSGTYTVSMKEDIMLFDSSKNSGVIINYSLDGKSYSAPLAEFLTIVQNLTGSSSIVLNEESYRELQHSSIAGISAKATKNNQFIFARGMTNKKLLNYAESMHFYDERVWALRHLYSLYHSKKQQIKAEHADYTALYNYIVSKIYPVFIGENNSLVLTRQGLKTTYEFLQDNFNQKRYIRASENVRLSGKYDIQIERDF